MWKLKSHKCQKKNLETCFMTSAREMLLRMTESGIRFRIYNVSNLDAARLQGNEQTRKYTIQ